MESLHDVIVIGGGPAGATSAALLAEAGYRVLLVERSTEAAPHLPETHLGLPAELLRRLDIEPAFSQCLSAPAPVSFRRLGASPRFRIDLIPEPTSAGLGLAIDRAKLGALLLERARARGAEVLGGATVEVVDLGEGAPLVQTARGGASATHRARVVLDASGKMGVLRKLLSLPARTQKLDDRVAVFSHFADGPLRELVAEDGMTVTAFEEGYLLVASMASRFSVIAVLGEAAARAAGDAPAAVFSAAVERWPELREAIARSTRMLPVIPAMNYSIECERFGGPGYALVGDAAAFVDPFFCPGLGTAMEMAEVAADALAAALDRRWGPEETDAYEAKARAILARRHDEVYRWLDAGAVLTTSRAFADPHMPWIVPAFFLGLLAGSGAPWAPPAHERVRGISRAVRNLYSSI